MEVLEAALVLPYKGEYTNRLDNGLLLRADLHTLLDYGLLWVTPKNTAALAPSLLTTDYAVLLEKPLDLPASSSLRPNRVHLGEQANACMVRHYRG